MKIIHKKRDENIVQENTGKNEQKISPELNPAMEIRTRKNDMTIQHIPCGETNDKRYEKSGNLGFKRNRPDNV